MVLKIILRKYGKYMDEINKLELENRILKNQINEVYQFALDTRNQNIELLNELEKFKRILRIRLFLFLRRALLSLKKIVYED
jgi:hypothetical protein